MRRERDQDRQRGCDLHQEINDLRLELTATKYELTDCQQDLQVQKAAAKAHVRSYEAELKQREDGLDPRSAGCLAVRRWQADAKRSQSMLSMRTSAFEQRQVQNLNQARERESKIHVLDANLARCFSDREKADQRLDEMKIEMEEQYEFLLNELMEARRGEQTSQARTSELEARLIGADRAAAASGPGPDHNRAAGVPRRPGYVSGPAPGQ